MTDVAVFYLARLAEGFSAFEKFANSYRKFVPGVDHTLILICKGFKRRTEYAVLASIFKGIPYELTSVDDDIGQDIHAYKTAVVRFPHRYCCFLNTFSEVQSASWLKKLYDAIQPADVGLVGASGSFESLNNSWEVLHGLTWMLGKVAFNRHIAQSFEWIISRTVTNREPHSIKMRLRRFVGAVLRQRPPFRIKMRLRRFVGAVLRQRPPFQKVLPRLPSIWASTPHFAKDFPYFPNPHIRSNAFMVRRDDIIKTPLRGDNPKFACCHFESGKKGLSASVLRSGRRLICVGADGRAYDVSEWATSGCFRSGDQSNLLIADNQTTMWKKYSELERKTHLAMTWGGYLKGNLSSVLDVTFDAIRPLADFMPHPAAPQRRPLISVVIPTHDRKELLLDALKTVRAQGYENYEIVVFDNASRQQVRPSLDALKDARIKCERSDTVLPVTKSWNRAIRKATGDYIILIGDDDGLAPGYFKHICELVSQFDEPDLIYSSLYQFFHPGVLRHRPLGYVQTMPMADFMSRRDFPFILSKSEADRSISNSLNLHRSFMFNMPAFTVSRKLLKVFDGEVFRPPFPDYHFANFAFAKASKIVIEPRSIAFQGISTASFGFTLFNNKTEDGFKILGHDLNDDVRLLPGDNYLSHYIVTMSRLAKDIGAPEPDFKRYRQLMVYRQLSANSFSTRWILKSDLWKRLTLLEKLEAAKWIAIQRIFVFQKMRHPLNVRMSLYSFSPMQVLLNDGDLLNGAELYAALQNGRIRTRA
jgi:glycosyltransferase involved in cell wall biosynthesis